MTQALGMAPGLKSLVIYVGSSDTAIISAMTTHSPLPTTIGCSWGWTPADPSTLDPYFQKMAAQGQNFFAASGDSSTWSAETKPGRPTTPMSFLSAEPIWSRPAQAAHGSQKLHGSTAAAESPPTISRFRLGSRWQA